MEGVGGRAESGEERAAREREREKLVGEIAALRDQLGHMRDECTQVGESGSLHTHLNTHPPLPSPPSLLLQVEAECTALRNMVEERNAFITTMKSEIYRKEYLNDTERADLHTQLLHKDTLIKKLEVSLNTLYLLHTLHTL